MYINVNIQIRSKKKIYLSQTKIKKEYWTAKLKYILKYG
ncbi:hypothetical protein M115_2410 [Bacteroides fragilis str. 3719 T6]|nr:hypothetical protein M115_2410 [Bacteroides fragilis str. 3719 T6]